MNQILQLLDEGYRQGALNLVSTTVYMREGLSAFEMYESQKVAALYGRFTASHTRIHIRSSRGRPCGLIWWSARASLCTAASSAGLPRDNSGGAVTGTAVLAPKVGLYCSIVCQSAKRTMSKKPTVRHSERVLIRTKLNRPALPSRQAERPRLLDRLDQASQRRVTLISAPAGYGRTTVAVQWLERRTAKVAWVALLNFRASKEDSWLALVPWKSPPTSTAIRS